MTSYYQGHVAAITGAAGGMGRDLALQLVSKGCSIAICDVDEAGLKETVRLCNERSKRTSRKRSSSKRASSSRSGANVLVTGQRVDVTDKAQLLEWSEAIVRDHGRVSMLFNNAGIVRMQSFELLSADDFDLVMNINFHAVVNCTRIFLPLLKKERSAHLVNTASVFGLLGKAELIAYNAAKFALKGFSDSLKVQLDGTNVHLSVLMVGGVRTQLGERAAKDTGDAATAEGAVQLAEMAFTSSSEAVTKILAGVEAKQYRVMVGAEAKPIDMAIRLFPDAIYRSAAIHDAIFKSVFLFAFVTKKIGLTNESFVAFLMVLLGFIPALIMSFL